MEKYRVKMRMTIPRCSKQMKVIRTTTAMNNQRNSGSDSDSDALVREACEEGETSQQLAGLSLAAELVIKGIASKLFNVTEEQVENPQYWIDL